MKGRGARVGGSEGQTTNTARIVQVHLSTHPPTHTPDMFSWFPIYFPLKEPVYCPAGADVCMSMWRCTAYHKVWYEWAITQQAVTNIHNPCGRFYYVGL